MSKEQRMADHGLSEHELCMIASVLQPYAHKIERVGVFGSRATGKYRPDSDIDLVLYGNDLTEADQDRLFTLFTETMLALKVDVTIYHLVSYPPLRQHIDDVVRILELEHDKPDSITGFAGGGI